MRNRTPRVRCAVPLGSAMADPRGTVLQFHSFSNADDSAQMENVDFMSETLLVDFQCVHRLLGIFPEI